MESNQFKNKEKKGGSARSVSRKKRRQARGKPLSQLGCPRCTQVAKAVTIADRLEMGWSSSVTHHGGKSTTRHHRRGARCAALTTACAVTAGATARTTASTLQRSMRKVAARAQRPFPAQLAIHGGRPIPARRALRAHLRCNRLTVRTGSCRPQVLQGSARRTGSDLPAGRRHKSRSQGALIFLFISRRYAVHVESQWNSAKSSPKLNNAQSRNYSSEMMQPRRPRVRNVLQEMSGATSPPN